MEQVEPQKKILRREAAKLLREILGLKLGELTTVVKGYKGNVTAQLPKIKQPRGNQVLASPVSRSRLSHPDKALVFPASGDFSDDERTRPFYK
jgi:hypothetical protein